MAIDTCSVVDEIKEAIISKLEECDPVMAQGVLKALGALCDVQAQHCKPIWEVKKDLKEFDYVWREDD